jgi:hypothetical protein
MCRKVVYIITFLIALTVYVLQRLMVPLPTIINNYVNDLLYLPLVLGLIEFVIRKFKKDSLFKLPIAFVVFLASFYSFYFEYYLPGINPRYTADWIDVVLYFLGGFAYFFSEEMGNRKFSGEDF